MRKKLLLYFVKKILNKIWYRIGHFYHFTNSVQSDLLNDKKISIFSIVFLFNQFCLFLNLLIFNFIFSLFLIFFKAIFFKFYHILRDFLNLLTLICFYKLYCIILGFPPFYCCFFSPFFYCFIIYFQKGFFDVMNETLSLYGRFLFYFNKRMKLSLENRFKLICRYLKKI